MNARDCRSAHDAIPEWVGGGLADADRAWLRRHLDRCPDCRAALGDWRRVAGALAADRPQVTAPALDVALAKVDLAMSRPGLSPARRPVLRWASALGLLLVGLALTRVLDRRTGDEVAAPASQPAALRSVSSDGSRAQVLPARHRPGLLPDGASLAVAVDDRHDAHRAGEGTRLVDARLSFGSAAGRPSGPWAASGPVVNAAPMSLAATSPETANLGNGGTAQAASTTAAGGGNERGSGGGTVRTATPPPTATTTAPTASATEPPSPEPLSTEPPSATQPAATSPPTIPAPATQPAAFLLEGEVLDDLAQPIAGAYLEVWTEPDGSTGPVAYLTESDDSGHFSLALPAGGYRVHGEAANHEAAWLGGADRPSAQRLDLPAAPGTPRPRLVLRRLAATPQSTDTPTETPAPPATPTTVSEALAPVALGSKPRRALDI